MNYTTDRSFIDTNILVYLSSNEETKKGTVTNLVYGLENAVISTQVLGEFSNVIIRSKILPADKLTEYIQMFSESFEVYRIKAETIINAVKIKEKYRFSFWDSMIISAALETDCKILYSEDMQHLQKIENKLTIFNPFNE